MTVKEVRRMFEEWVKAKSQPYDLSRHENTYYTEQATQAAWAGFYGGWEKLYARLEAIVDERLSVSLRDSFREVLSGVVQPPPQK